MYAVLRKYTFDPKHSAEIAHHVQDGLLPLLRKTPGFVTYYWINTGEGTGTSCGVFQTKDGADQSVHLAADYVKEHLASILGKPEITAGNVEAHG